MELDVNYRPLYELVTNMLDLLGLEGGITFIDTCILRHYGYSDDLPEGFNLEDDIVVVGRRGYQIKKDDLIEALNKIAQIPFAEGRSYRFEGSDLRGNTLYFLWGS